MTRRPVRALSLAVPLLLLALSACQGSKHPLPPNQPHVPTGEIGLYVAMGDSYAAGPLISPKQDGSGICLRSKRNYPTLLAELLDIPRVQDVTCAGATTTHLLRDISVVQGATVRAQVKALSTKTKLVTVSVGYNNDAIFGNLFGACLPSAEVEASACQDFVTREVPDMLESARDDVREALEVARRRAPHATVVLVGYVPVLAEENACSPSVMSAKNQRLVYRTERQVDDNLRRSALVAGTEFVSMRELGRGHGVCAGKNAWVNGAKPTKGNGAEFHPTAAGMEAVAEAIATLLRTYG